MEIKKQQFREAGMSYAKSFLGPEQFKTNKSIASEICAHHNAGGRWLYVQAEAELKDLEAEKNLVLKHWDELKQEQDLAKKTAVEIETILKSKFRELTATGALSEVYKKLQEISGVTSKHQEISS